MTTLSKEISKKIQETTRQFTGMNVNVEVSGILAEIITDNSTAFKVADALRKKFDVELSPVYEKINSKGMTREEWRKAKANRKEIIGLTKLTFLLDD